MKANSYQSLDVEEATPPQVSDTRECDRTNLMIVRLVYWTAFLAVFSFYFFAVFSAFDYHSYLSIHGRRLEGGEGCHAKDIGTYVVAGAVVGAGALAGAFIAVGLMPFTGPIAGGLFAMNMGAGVAAGSLMAAAQSAAMTAVPYATAAAAGSLATTAAACQ